MKKRLFNVKYYHYSPFPPKADPPTAEAQLGKNMYFVYVLRSKKNNKRYIGYTSKDVQERLSEHNTGSSQWTRHNGPFELVYADECSELKEAKEFEKFLKSGQGRQCLDELKI